MKIKSLEIFCYFLPLVSSLTMMGQEITARHGRIIRMENEVGDVGLGEIAPFPGLHSEDISEAETQIVNLKSELLGQAISKNLFELNGQFEHWLGNYGLFPSVRFGIEMAALNLLAAANRQSLCGLLSEAPRKKISLNGLLTGNAENLSSQIKSLLDEGYQSIKLKVGRQSLADDISMVKAACQKLPLDTFLRLDANRAWSLPDAITFGNAIVNCNIEYIEEPLKNPLGLDTLYRETNMPIALDESLRDISPLSFKPKPATAALILKPGVLGGFERAMQFAQLAKKYHLKAVISSVFESGVGLVALANLAACVNSQDVPAGLDTYKWLKEDLLIEPFSADEGMVDILAINQRNNEIKFEKLVKVDS